MRTYPLLTSVALATTCAAALASASIQSTTTGAALAKSDGAALTRVLAAADQTPIQRNLRDGYNFADLDLATDESNNEARGAVAQIETSLLHSAIGSMENLPSSIRMAEQAKVLEQSGGHLLPTPMAAIKGKDEVKAIKELPEYNAAGERVAAAQAHEDLMVRTTRVVNYDEQSTNLLRLLPLKKEGPIDPHETVIALQNRVEYTIGRSGPEHDSLVEEFKDIKYAKHLSISTLTQMRDHKLKAAEFGWGDKLTPDGMFISIKNGQKLESHVGREDEVKNEFGGRVLVAAIPLSADDSGHLMVGMISASGREKFAPILAKGGLLKKEDILKGSMRELEEESGREVVPLREFQKMVYDGNAENTKYELHSFVGIASSETSFFSENKRSQQWINYDDFKLIAENSKQPLFGMGKRLAAYVEGVGGKTTNLYEEKLVKASLSTQSRT